MSETIELEINEMIELEIKLEAPDGFEPDFTGLAVVGPASEFELDATYVDTRARDLIRSGWSLRRREGGHDAGWHLKRPAPTGGRRELQRPLSPEVPDEIRAEVNERFGPIALAPSANVNNRRREVALTQDGRAVARLAFDTVQALAGGRASAWTEWELELVDSRDVAVLEELATALLAQGARPASFGSKIGRALGALPMATPLDAASSAAEVLQAYVERQIGMLQARAGAVRVDGPDAVHKARVATRRLRSLLKVYGDFYDAAPRDELCAELRWLASMLGAPRDAEVLAEEFGDLIAELGPEVVDTDVRHGLLDHLADTHTSAHATLVEAWDSERARALREALMAWLVAPPLTAAASELAVDALPAARDAAIRRVVRLRRRAERDGAVLECWHDVRKAAKRVRYATEALVAATPELAEDAGRWEDVTEALGTVQDAAVCSDVIEAVRHAAAGRVSRDPVWQVLLDAQSDRLAAGLAGGRQALSAALG